MWTFTRLGFSSAVKHRDQPETLIIRFRTKVDALRHVQFMRDDSVAAAWFESLGVEIPSVEHNIAADYAFRITLPAGLWSQVIARLADSVDYTNFKDMMHDQCPHWNAVLMRIWSDTRRVQDDQEWRRAMALDAPPARKRARKPLGIKERVNGEVWESDGDTLTLWGGRHVTLKVGAVVRRAGRDLEFRGLQSLMGGGHEVVFRDVLLCADVSIPLPASPADIAGAVSRAVAQSRASAESRMP